MAKQQLDVLDQLHKLDEQRAELLGKAKAQALEEAQAAIESLNTLGFNYKLTQAVQPLQFHSTAERQGTRTPADQPCPICEFKTFPLHDRRSHRTQSVKAPFTADELRQKGLQRV